ncbi:hypothetical protein [Paracoccus sediminicola]|uniref:hypothetical protein n=1 Tax=Paracoccus sediminicola TaxID=3017783 RepID=UPI0022F0CC01|nr:hypothetical protein [Paracoccus sediminicola]WBU56997.1 hypothetical protein PAF18_00695 [Paracoccus sediminicola]
MGGHLGGVVSDADPVKLAALAETLPTSFDRAALHVSAVFPPEPYTDALAGPIDRPR